MESTRISTLPPTRGIGAAAIAAALVLALGLGACASMDAPATPAADAARFPMLTPASFGRSAQLDQVLHAAYGDQEASIQCLVTITPQRISMVGLTALGQRIFTLEYDGTALQAERASFAPDRVQPQRILADLQLALWPLDALQAATAAGPWRVTEPRPGLRRLRREGVLIAEVHRADATRLWLTQLRDGYSLDISSREVGP